jgi:hypothetical protein
MRKTASVSDRFIRAAANFFRVRTRRKLGAQVDA